MTRVYEDVRGMLDINSSDLLNSHLIMLDFLTVCVNKKHSAASLNTPQNGGTFKLPGKLSSDITLQLEAPTNDITALIWSHVSLHSTILSYDPRRLCVSADCSTSLREKKKKSELLFRNQSAKKCVYFIRFSLVFLPHVSTQKYTQWSVYQLRLPDAAVRAAVRVFSLIIIYHLYKWKQFNSSTNCSFQLIYQINW